MSCDPLRLEGHDLSLKNTRLVHFLGKCVVHMHTTQMTLCSLHAIKDVFTQHYILFPFFQTFEWDLMSWIPVF